MQVDQYPNPNPNPIPNPNQVDKYRPETCCVIGNYYSLKGEHEKAVRLRVRARVRVRVKVTTTRSRASTRRRYATVTPPMHPYLHIFAAPPPNHLDTSAAPLPLRRTPTLPH